MCVLQRLLDGRKRHKSLAATVIATQRGAGCRRVTRSTGNTDRGADNERAVLASASACSCCYGDTRRRHSRTRRRRYQRLCRHSILTLVDDVDQRVYRRKVSERHRRRHAICGIRSTAPVGADSEDVKRPHSQHPDGPYQQTVERTS